jgi:hypothetical protein
MHRLREFTSPRLRGEVAARSAAGEGGFPNAQPDGAGLDQLLGHIADLVVQRLMGQAA